MKVGIISDTIKGISIVSFLKDKLFKERKKDYVEAAVSASMMMVYASDHVGEKEKKKLLNYLYENDSLSVFKDEEIKDAFVKYEKVFELDKEIAGKAALLAVSPFLGDELKTKLLIRTVCHVTAEGMPTGRVFADSVPAEGLFQPKEKEVVLKICKELDISIFDIGPL